MRGRFVDRGGLLGLGFRVGLVFFVGSVLAYGFVGFGFPGRVVLVLMVVVVVDLQV